MTFDFNYKRIIMVLMIGLIFLGGLFWYREQSTNKQVPKRANFVKMALEENEVYG